MAVIDFVITSDQAHLVWRHHLLLRGLADVRERSLGGNAQGQIVSVLTEPAILTRV